MVRRYEEIGHHRRRVARIRMKLKCILKTQTLDMGPNDYSTKARQPLVLKELIG